MDSFNVSNFVLPIAKQIRIYAEKVLSSIPDKIYSTKPRSGDTIIDCNHPAFTTGHLALYPNRIMRLLGEEIEVITPPNMCTELCMIGKTCEDDPERKIYPSKSAILPFFLNSTDFVLERLESLPDARWLAENVDERSMDRYKIVGSFIAYLLTAHTNVHLGQISTWRRCMGLGPV